MVCKDIYIYIYIYMYIHYIATGWTFLGSNRGGGARFSILVQTGHEAHPASSKMDTGSFPAGMWRLLPTPFSAEAKERV